ncbi:MAG: endonuclease domain-containing protein [Gemmataceae bacterium]
MTPDEARVRSRTLRRNLTDAERHVWTKLRDRRFEVCKFRRQVPLGPYIVDFVTYEFRIVLEFDGGQHAEQKEYDDIRTRWLTEQGFRVMRFWNHDVFENWDTIEEMLWRAIEAARPGQDITAQRKFIMLFFKGTQADATALSENLKRELSAEITRAGGSPHISALPNEAPGGYGFRLEYELGAVRGDVRVAIRENTGNPRVGSPFGMGINLMQSAQGN